MSDCFIVGQAGALEARFSNIDSAKAAVLCHPHPQYGGSMDDMVLGAIKAVLLEQGMSSYRLDSVSYGLFPAHHTASSNSGKVTLFPPIA